MASRQKQQKTKRKGRRGRVGGDVIVGLLLIIGGSIALGFLLSSAGLPWKPVIVFGLIFVVAYTFLVRD